MLLDVGPYPVLKLVSVILPRQEVTYTVCRQKKH